MNLFEIIDSSATNQKNLKHVNEKGMSWLKTANFIVADMIGAGMVALPVAVGKSGLIPGIILLTLGAIFSCLTGIQLSQNWVLMQQRWEEYRSHCRRPYPEMAYRALGLKAKYILDVCLAISLYGVITVYILLSANNIKMLVEGVFGIYLDFCISIILVFILLWPFVLLKSPMHFWQAAVVSAISIVIAAILILVGVFRDLPVCSQHVSHPPFTWQNVFVGYGTMIFSYGGHNAFPTFQHDMKKTYHFSRSLLLSYTCILLVYLTISVTGLEIYGDSLRETIIPSIQTKWIAISVNILITVHILPAIILTFSPLAQLVEEWCKIPHEFGPKRVILRTLALFFCIFSAMSVPKLGIVLDLVGATTTTLMSMLLPTVFWLYLNTSNKLQLKTGDRLPTISEIIENTPRLMLLTCIVSLSFGLIGGVAATATAVNQLFSFDMAPPCYLSWFASTNQTATNLLGNTNCCGPFRNITVSGISPEGFCQL